MSSGQVVNPLTGRKVKVNGKTYMRLVKEGVLKQKKVRKVSSARKETPKKSTPKKMKTVLSSPKRKRVVKSPKAAKEPQKRGPKKIVGVERIKLDELNNKIELPSHKKKLLSKLKKNVEEGRGAKTRGWRVISPQKGFQRHELKDKCGKKCFLEPENEKYPICPRYDINKKCQVSCRGLASAKLRASQYKNKNVLDQIEKLENKYC